MSVPPETSPAARTEIATFGDARVLVVERFDRRWTSDKRLLRLPQEDLAKLFRLLQRESINQAGMPRSTVEGVLDELLKQAPGAIASASEQLPRNFPEHIRRSIIDGLRARLSVLREDPRA